MSALSSIGFVGGTGPQGRGLGVRLALAGHRCVIGSRTAEKGAEAAESVRSVIAEAGREGELPHPIVGTDNAGAAECDLVVVVLPQEAQAKTLPPLADRLSGKIVVNCVNAIGFDDAGPFPQRVPAGSAAEECQQLVPEARVVGAFQNVSAVKLRKLDGPVETDVVLTGDDQTAREQVAALASAIPGMRPVHAGPLRLTGPVEDMTALLVAVNKRYRVNSSLRLSGIPDDKLGADA
ncbi:NADPH-dependent F420 reductase [Egibacter rhizosphaerae]|uniref:NADPH-dependent F420 reductase n=1 Tax=Egibacter rhizosphaerae TaxID=1670831 RepID=A0A411YAL8_9ACTN|nr:NADPH-dependent F420 reductase [Egibacter rhizosphaerae]QBI18245.1 NADPH-dependent F420 reductase [Egibacter rhizosphaerae]